MAKRILNVERIVSLTSDPASAEGGIYYNSVTKKLRYHNGTAWADIASASGSTGQFTGDTPPGSPSVGDIWYDTTSGKTYIWYDSFWIEIGFSETPEAIVLSGDVTGTGTGNIATTLGPSGVGAGTYGSATNIPVLTVDVKGRVTAASTASVATTIDGLTDVNITAVANNNLLAYSSGTAEWINTSTLSGLTLVTPTIASFTNATHNHSNAAGGGNIPESSVTNLVSDLAAKAPTASPTFTGTVTTPLTTAGYVTTTSGGVLGSVSTIPNAGLTNSSVTIGSTSVSLGATAATIAGLTLTTPTIASFTNAQHNHSTAATGGNIPQSSVTNLTTDLSNKQPLDADLTAIAGLAGTSGLARKTAANTWSLDTATYLTGNQTITLSGDVSGSGTTAITTTVANDSHTHGDSTIDGLDASATTTGTFNIARIPTGTSGTTVAFGNHNHSGVYEPADADLSAIAALAGTSGLLRKTAANTWSLDTASYLTGNQTITLSGDVSGSGTTAITVTVADDSHNHIISNVDGLQTALDAKAPLASPTFTGTVTSPAFDTTIAVTATAATHYFMAQASDGVIRPKTLANVRTEIVTTAAVNAAAATTVGTITSGTWQGSVISATYIDSAIARLASPAFTGTPTAPTQTAGNNTTRLATTAFVQTAVSGIVGGASYQTTAPTSPSVGQIWVDSDETYNTLNSNDYLLKSGGTVTGNLTVEGILRGEQFMVVSLSDESTALTAGTTKLAWRAPFALTLTQIPRASLTTASSSGLVTVDINENGTSVLGANKLSIDANEKTSTTAATATTLADTSIADDAEITFDIDAAGTGATGLKVVIYYRRT